jgi:UDP-3-O-[3-hydroxymyristoyl] glucosamine N-acyltransferase
MEPQSFRISELAEQVGGRVVADEDRFVERISGLEDADERSIVFIDDPKLLPRVARSNAGCCITPPLEQEVATPRIEVRNPKLAFAILAARLHSPRRRPPGVHPTAVIAPTARIDPTAHVGPHVQVEADAEIGAFSQILSGAHIGEGVRIGRTCVIHPGVVLYDSVLLGDRVVLHAGVVIGADGFGYVRGPEGYVKFPQVGGVVIEDDVEVGANTCIDRGALGTTRIGRGTKIDNLVMVAHNVQIGERVIIAGQAGISGSTCIGNDVVLAGQVGLADHVKLHDGVQVGAKSAVFPGKIVAAGSVVMGIPARPLDHYKRVSAQLNRLTHFRAELGELRNQVEHLSRQLEAASSVRADSNEDTGSSERRDFGGKSDPF